jgi:predicted DNA-binding protein with PD1-like motif
MQNFSPRSSSGGAPTYFRLARAFLLLLSFSIHVAAQAVAPAQKRQTITNAASEIDISESGETDGLRVYAVRLKPHQDLRKALELFARERKLQAGLILTAVGSLERATLRLADQSGATPFGGKYEIVSLVGTLSPDGVHLHLSLSDSTGKTIGGHLVEGCEIYTTAEIVIAEARGLLFKREQDAGTGYKELKIYKNRRSGKRR